MLLVCGTRPYQLFAHGLAQKRFQPKSISQSVEQENNAPSKPGQESQTLAYEAIALKICNAQEQILL